MVLNDKTTLAQYAKEWFPIKTSGLSHNSRVMYQNAINVHIVPFFGNMKLNEIKPFHVQKLMSEKANMSNSAQSKILLTLSQIIVSAEENGLISKNPCKGVKAGGEHPKTKKPLTTKQQAELVKAVTGTRAEIFVLLCLYAGLRREEALGITWDSVHLDNAPYVEIRHAVTFDNNKPIHSDRLKSKAARRSIPIPPILTDALKTAREGADGTFIIKAVKTGEVMSHIAFQRMWEIATKTVPFYITPHLLRHTYLTELCASGLDIKKIQYLAGHEDVNMTLKIYAHVKDNKPENLSDKIAEIFSGVKTGVNPKSK